MAHEHSLGPDIQLRRMINRGEAVAVLINRLGYVFKNEQLLEQALTHSSGAKSKVGRAMSASSSWVTGCSD